MGAVPKRPLGIDVLTAARQRIAYILRRCPRVYLSGPSGKDSGVMMHLVCQEAREMGRRVGVLYIDLEAQYRATVDFVGKMFRLYGDVIEPHWLCLPVALRNAVSQFQPKWCAWDPDARGAWVREPPPGAIVDPGRFPWYRPPEPGRAGETAMEFEEIVPAFGAWYAQGELTACFVGIRTGESLNRWRAIAGDHSRFTDPDTGERHCWTTYKGGTVYNAYPLYDWTTADVWRFYGKTGLPYPKTYDLMHRAGLSIHEQRICQPYGDDQRRGLWLFSVLEPETWARVVSRVSGANMGALYAQERGSVQGRHHVTKPAGMTWEQYAKVLLASLPPKSRQQFENNFSTFLAFYAKRGMTTIPDEADPALEAARKAPSWRRLVKCLLKNDYWAKTLSFNMRKSDTAAWRKYQKLMERRRQKWGPQW